MTKWEAVPTGIGLDTQLKQTPPTGKTVVFLQCELSQCGDVGAGVEAAAKAVGWTYKSIQFQSSNPATLIAAMQQALQYKPVAVSFSALPQVTWASEVPIYQKAGVILVPTAVGAATTGPTDPAVIDPPEVSTLQGQIIADWVTADSNGDAHVLVWNAPAFGALIPGEDGFDSTLAQTCSACTTTHLNSTPAQVDDGSNVASIVATLQRNPQDKYVFVTAGGFAQGLAGALKAAGLSDVKVCGTGASVENEQDLTNGTESAFTGIAIHYWGWQVVDVAARHLEGMAISPTDGGPSPTQLLVKATVGAPSTSFDRPANFEQLFEHLWKVA